LKTIHFKNDEQTVLYYVNLLLTFRKASWNAIICCRNFWIGL